MYGACKINIKWPQKDIFLHLHIDYVVPTRQAEMSFRRGKIRSRRSVKKPRGKYRFNKSGEYWLINPGNLVGIHRRQGLGSFTFRLLIKDTQAWDIFFSLFAETKYFWSQEPATWDFLKLLFNLVELFELQSFCFGWVCAKIVSKLAQSVCA